MSKRKQDWIYARVVGGVLTLEGRSSNREGAEEIWLHLSRKDAAWLEAILQAFRMRDDARVTQLNDNDWTRE
jgi:hypothetical protein